MEESRYVAGERRDRGPPGALRPAHASRESVAIRDQKLEAIIKCNTSKCGAVVTPSSTYIIATNGKQLPVRMAIVEYLCFQGKFGKRLIIRASNFQQNNIFIIITRLFTINV